MSGKDGSLAGFAAQDNRLFLFERYCIMCDLPSPLRERRSLGSLRAAADGPAGYFYDFWVVDTTNPISPLSLGRYTGEEEAHRILPSGNSVYVAKHSGLDVLDLTNPSNPVRAGAYFIGFDSSVGDLAVADLSPEGNTTSRYVFALVNEGPKGAVHMLDVTDSAHPLLVSKYQPETETFAYRTIYSSGRLFVQFYDTQKGQSELHVLDVRNPSRPVRLNAADALPAPEGAWALTRDQLLLQSGGRLLSYRLIEVPRFIAQRRLSTGDFSFNFIDSGADLSRFTIESATSLSNPVDWTPVEPFGGISVAPDGSFQAAVPGEGKNMHIYRIRSLP
jgi:hypothetical protein